MTKSYNTTPDEIWMDAEGTLMTPCVIRTRYGDEEVANEWFVFGVESSIHESHPLVAHPLVKVFEADGTRVFDGSLPYPTYSKLEN